MDVLRPNQIFVGRYRIERFLAKGGFGAVFIAEQTATEMKVAIKVLWPHVLGSKDAVEKFQLEARVAARVKSDHIVKVFDAGFDAETGLPFIVMELLDGQPLEDHVKSSGPMSSADAVHYLRQVAMGLDKAHGYVDRDGQPRPIVHRDLKPENLFLTRRETGERIVKILDFGIAKVLSASTDVSREVKGTPLFMAHEQAVGDPVSPRTDVWALGLIAHYLLTGDHYWKSASNPEATMSALFVEILTLPIDPPSQRQREMGKSPPWPAAFDAWFTSCVERDPQRRFASAGAAITALAAALEVPMAPFGVDSSLAPLSQVAVESAARGVDAVTANAMAVSNAPATTQRPASRARVYAISAVLTVCGLGAAGVLLRPVEEPATDPESSASAVAGASVAPAATAMPPAAALVTSSPAPSALADAGLTPTTVATPPSAGPRPLAQPRPRPSAVAPSTSAKPPNNLYDER